MRAVTRSGQKGGQHVEELAGMLSVISGQCVRRYLEIGVRYGDTFHAVMSSLPAGSVGVAVDLPGSLWGTKGSDIAMNEAVDDLRALGYEVHLILGDSTDRTIIDAVATLGPYDFALIDGDHRYSGVKADWQNYGHLCGAVAFHDIVGHGQRHDAISHVEVPRFWQEVKQGLRNKEIIGRNSTMGIGVVWNT